MSLFNRSFCKKCISLPALNNWYIEWLYTAIHQIFLTSFNNTPQFLAHILINLPALQIVCRQNTVHGWYVCICVGAAVITCLHIELSPTPLWLQIALGLWNYYTTHQPKQIIVTTNSSCCRFCVHALIIYKQQFCHDSEMRGKIHDKYIFVYGY